MSGSLPSLCDTFIPAIRISNLFDLSEVWKILHHLEQCWSLLCLALGTIPPWLPPWSGACGPREEMWKPSRKVTYQLPEALSGLRNQHARFAQSANPQRAGSKWTTMSWPNRAHSSCTILSALAPSATVLNCETQGLETHQVHTASQHAGRAQVLQGSCRILAILCHCDQFLRPRPTPGHQVTPGQQLRLV